MNYYISIISIVFFLHSKINAQEQRKNVILISVDDLNDWIGPYNGHPQSQTPSIDKLSDEGVTFTQCWPTVPWCNPSRVSLLTGIHPLKSGVISNDDFPLRKFLPNAKTIVEKFSDAGYYTYGLGKIFHKEDNLTEKWDKYDVLSNRPKPKIMPAHGIEQIEQNKHSSVDWASIDQPKEKWGDYQISQHAIDFLEKYEDDEPFFLALGFRLPHLPWYYPSEFEVSDNDLEMPKNFVPTGFEARLQIVNWIKNAGQLEPAIRAYLSSIKFIDYNIGLLLKELERKNYLDNTILVFYSDHGYHLGEKKRWAKVSLWNEALITPLIIVTPDGDNTGSQCNIPVSLMDIYPTLMELCQIKPSRFSDGKSLAGALKSNKNLESNVQFSMIPTPGYAVADNKFKYLEWGDFKGFYSNTDDLEEYHNLYKKAENGDNVFLYQNILDSIIDKLRPFEMPLKPTDPQIVLDEHNIVFSWKSIDENLMYDVLVKSPEGVVNFDVDSTSITLPSGLLINSHLSVSSYNPKFSSEWSDAIHFGLQIFPNPVYYETTLEFSVEINGPLKIELYNLAGQRVFELKKNIQNEKRVILDLSSSPKGIFIVKIQIGINTLTKKIIVI